MAYRQGVPGISGLAERTLRYDPETGDSTRMLPCALGADASPMGVQQHIFWGETWIRVERGPWHGGVDSNGLSLDAFASLEVERPLRSYRLLQRERV